ncbi:CAP domain-containing protein [Kitasatospora aureofaciens]|uniref:CAP domain-containing protein n=1 Tax=Kitasatospora aureofaciens TaxID=1894 RepID=UPI0037F93C2A
MPSPRRGRHRRSRHSHAPRLATAVGVVGVGLAMPLITASGSSAIFPRHPHGPAAPAAPAQRHDAYAPGSTPGHGSSPWAFATPTASGTTTASAAPTAVSTHASAVPSTASSASPTAPTPHTSWHPSASSSPSATSTPAPTSAAARPAAPSAAPTASARPTAAGSDAVQQVLALINQARASQGLPAYTISAGLTSSAQAHNQVMAAGCGLSHQCPNENELGARESAAGVQWNSAGENIGDGGPVSTASQDIATEAVALTQDMLNEQPPNDGHRQNILSTSFTHIGIAVHRDASGTVWMTQDFSN